MQNLESQTEIKLNCNYQFKEQSCQQIIDYFTKLEQKNYTKIYFTDNNLGNLRGKELEHVMRCLPLSPSVKDFVISSNNLGNLDGKELENVIRIFPQQLEFLHFSHNNLGNLGKEILFNVLGALPKSLKVLYLNSNKLTQDMLENVVGALPKSLKVLNLRDNNLDNIDGVSLANVFNVNLWSDIKIFMDEESFSDEQFQFFAKALNKNIQIEFWDKLKTQELDSFRKQPGSENLLKGSNKKYILSASVTIASYIIEAVLILALKISLTTTLMLAAAIGGPILLGVIAAVVYMCCQYNENTVPQPDATQIP